MNSHYFLLPPPGLRISCAVFSKIRGQLMHTGIAKNHYTSVHELCGKVMNAHHLPSFATCLSYDFSLLILVLRRKVTIFKFHSKI